MDRQQTNTVRFMIFILRNINDRFDEQVPEEG